LNSVEQHLVGESRVMSAGSCHHFRADDEGRKNCRRDPDDEIRNRLRRGTDKPKTLCERRCQGDEAGECDSAGTVATESRSRGKLGSDLQDIS
jgi:hypothetical protein